MILLARLLRMLENYLSPLIILPADSKKLELAAAAPTEPKSLLIHFFVSSLLASSHLLFRRDA